MSSGCFHCAQSFSMFRREHACSECGFAFCAKCLHAPPAGVAVAAGAATGAVPKGAKVCQSCLKRLKGEELPLSSALPPPSALERRLQQLSQPPAATPQNPILMFPAGGGGKMARLRRGMSLDDQKIVDRLENLKRDRHERIPTDHDVAERLAKLKGRDPAAEAEANVNVNGGQDLGAAAAFYSAPDQRSQVRRSEDLLGQMRDEVAIDRQRPDPADEIAQRLARLKGIEPEGLSDKNASVEEPEELEELPSDEEADRLIRQVMEEQKLEEALGADDLNTENSSPSPVRPDLAAGAEALTRQATRQLRTSIGSKNDDDDDEEELPWCTICNGDATLRCRECDGDLYCQRCFRECHGEFDEQHTPQKYAKGARKQ